MSGDTKYVLDASVLIQAFRNYYACDIAPGFWDALVEYAAKGKVLSIDLVKEEVERKEDRLKEWATGRFCAWFDSTDQDGVINVYQQIINWVERQRQFFPWAKSEFASGADGWVIAYAKVKGYTVVTQEQFSSDVKRKVPIPNVCRAFDVPYVDAFSMLRALGVKLVLGNL